MRLLRRAREREEREKERLKQREEKAGAGLCWEEPSVLVLLFDQEGLMQTSSLAEMNLLPLACIPCID